METIKVGDKVKLSEAFLKKNLPVYLKEQMRNAIGIVTYAGLELSTVKWSANEESGYYNESLIIIS